MQMTRLTRVYGGYTFNERSDFQSANITWGAGAPPFNTFFGCTPIMHHGCLMKVDYEGGVMGQDSFIWLFGKKGRAV